MKYISRMLSESLPPEIPEKNVMYNTGVVEALLVGTVNVRRYGVIYCRPVTSMNIYL
jgi:hypothetical protein